jgi:hypothetical protein
MNPFIIGTGYFNRDPKTYDTESFYRTWWKNTMRYAAPKRIAVIAAGGHHVSPKTMRECPADWIHLDGDLGHIHHLTGNQKPFEYSGFTMTLLTLALLAYQNECDLIFKEQDCLAFGPYVETMYKEIGDGQMIFGTGKMMPVFQSLMLIKHWFLPHFVYRYLGCGSERDKSNEGEQKHKRLMDKEPHFFKTFSFPFDRDRPLDITLPVWYAQQCSNEELQQISKAGLLEL